MLTCLLVVLFVEAADELLKYRPHPMVVEAWVLDRPVTVQDRIGTQVDVGRKELLN